MNKLISTISSPEFINLQPLDMNPGLSSCEIKVLYVGANRNGSFISKDVATEMSKTLRGAPIVGWFREESNDFGDHGHGITFDEEKGIQFECYTKPYGFVAPDAKVWFQEFDETDEKGNTVRREYLMTTGYLWAGQFEECQSVINNGKGQSMELDEKTLNGEWAIDEKNGREFFIINDAVFSKLCILGDDVEPCFEGASVTSPVISNSFSLDDAFKKTLFSMMNDLKTIIEGGKVTMDENKDTAIETEVETVEVEAPAAEETVEDSTPVVAEEFAKRDEEEEKKDEKEDEEKPSEDESSDEDKKDDEEDDKKKRNFELAELESKYSKLQSDYENLKKDYDELVSFKLSIENDKKDELISQFTMLSDEDKKDVIDNKANYTLEEIESKLAVICFHKKVNFSMMDVESAPEADVEIPAEEEKANPVIYQLTDDEAVPVYL